MDNRGKFQVNITMIGDAFEIDARTEVVRILKEITKKVQEGHNSGIVNDLNGNKAATFLKSSTLRRAGKSRSWGSN